jgi:hypothetical protein
VCGTSGCSGSLVVSGAGGVPDSAGRRGGGLGAATGASGTTGRPALAGGGGAVRRAGAERAGDAPRFVDAAARARAVGFDFRFAVPFAFGFVLVFVFAFAFGFAARAGLAAAVVARRLAAPARVACEADLRAPARAGVRRLLPRVFLGVAIGCSCGGPAAPVRREPRRARDRRRRRPSVAPRGRGRKSARGQPPRKMR